MASDNVLNNPVYFLKYICRNFFYVNSRIFFIGDKLLHLLERLKIGIIINDAPGRRDCAHMNLTIPKTFVRFICDGMNDIDVKRINAWKMQLERWLGLRSDPA